MIVSGKDPSRGCYFCGAMPRSKEHILPKWLAEALPMWDRSRFRKHEHEERASYVKDWGRSVLQQTVKEVCADCNSGWMSELEATMQPRILQLLMSDEFMLAANHLRDLRRWAIKTHMMRAQFDAAGFPFPQEHRDAIRSGKSIRVGWDVWLIPTSLDGVSHKNWSVLFAEEHGNSRLSLSQTTLMLGTFTIVVSYVSDVALRRDFVVFLQEFFREGGVSVSPIPDDRMFVFTPHAGSMLWPQANAISDAMRRWVNDRTGAGFPILAGPSIFD